jgi:hypothetical protein
MDRPSIHADIHYIYLHSGNFLNFKDSTLSGPIDKNAHTDPMKQMRFIVNG